MSLGFSIPSPALVVINLFYVFSLAVNCIGNKMIFYFDFFFLTIEYPFICLLVIYVSSFITLYDFVHFSVRLFIFFSKNSLHIKDFNTLIAKNLSFSQI